MPKPELNKPPAKFPHKLHKKIKDKHGKVQKSFAQIFGKHISVRDKVNMSGTHGQEPTRWAGTITKDNGGGNYESDDLEVTHEEVRTGPPGRPTEDVSVTVTNLDTGTSDPETTPKVETID